MKPRAPAGEARVIAGHRDLELRRGTVALRHRERAFRTRGEEAAEDRIATHHVAALDGELGLAEAQQRQRASSTSRSPAASARRERALGWSARPLPSTTVRALPLLLGSRGRADGTARRARPFRARRELGTGCYDWLIREYIAAVSLLDLRTIFEGARYPDHRERPIDRPPGDVWEVVTDLESHPRWMLAFRLASRYIRGGF